MNEAQFDSFIAQCVSELAHKQTKAIEKYNIGSYDSYWFDQDTRRLQFKDKDGKVMQDFPVIVIGSYAHNKGNWMWAWANKSINDNLKKDSEKIKSLVGLTGFNIFNEAMLEADNKVADEMVAMAVHALNALFMYRIPGEKNHLFLAIVK